MNIKTALNHAAKYLDTEQLANGGFASISRPSKDTKRGVATYETTFFASLILRALHSVKLESLDPIRTSLAAYLLEQRSEKWSFNYWAKQSPQYTGSPYPDDLDDTFCALAAIQNVVPDEITPTVLAATAKLLVANEVEEGGPYKTWLINSEDPVWNDVDLAVNANIAGFLALHGVTLPSITTLVETSIREKAIRSPYYPNVYPIIYFIARWYRGDCVDLLIKQIVARKQGIAWRQPQRTALAVTSLLNLGYDPERLRPAIDYLLQLQRSEGSWESEAFCIDPFQNGVVHYGSSRALTTALCMEAVSLFTIKVADLRIPKVKTQTSSVFYDSIISNIDAYIDSIQQSDLRRSLQSIRAQITKQDNDQQIVLLPVLVAKAFDLQPPDSLLADLARASVWGWMAYSTYDDFLDGEGVLGLLPAANVCLRKLVDTLQQTLPGDSVFHNDVNETLNRLDAANAWEMAHCRGIIKEEILHLQRVPDYGDYWQLADRSIGHTISALGVLHGSELEHKNASLEAIRDFMYHYLIARQLNDDAHDWYEDLRFGHVNAVATRLLNCTYPVIPRNGLRINIASRRASLEKLLWEEVIEDVCKDIQQHIDLARAALCSPSLPIMHKALEKLLDPIERAARVALQKRNESLEFIAAL